MDRSLIKDSPRHYPLRRAIADGAGRIFRRIRSLAVGESYSHGTLDLKLRRFLNFKHGFFVEAGANDGLRHSNTLYFEKYRHWSGLLIEPIEPLARLCAENRPRCLVENCALVAFGYPHATIEMEYRGLRSHVKGTADFPEEERRHVEHRLESFTLTVPARTLTSVLDRHHLERFDFLSLDVEGYELEALQGIDFDRYRPRFMLIEARYRDEIDTFLKSLYEPIAELSHHDVLYRSHSGP